MKFPDTDGQRMLLGSILILGLFVVALVFGLGKVTEQESYGLMPIVVALSGIATAFAVWAFKGEGPKKGD